MLTKSARRERIIDCDNMQSNAAHDKAPVMLSTATLQMSSELRMTVKFWHAFNYKSVNVLDYMADSSAARC